MIFQKYESSCTERDVSDRALSLPGCLKGKFLEGSGTDPSSEGAGEARHSGGGVLE
jgi:hypothetical protein